MATTPNLLVGHLEANSDQPEVVVDVGFDAFDAAISGATSFGVGSSNALAITQAQMAGCFLARLTDLSPGSSGLITVTIAAFKRGAFVVKNDTGHDADIKVAGQTVGIPRVPTGKRRLLDLDDIDGVTDPDDLQVYTVANLPSAHVRYRRAWVSDGAAAPVFSAAPTGGGSLLLPVYDDGTTWRYG